MKRLICSLALALVLCLTCTSLVACFSEGKEEVGRLDFEEVIDKDIEDNIEDNIDDNSEDSVEDSIEGGIEDNIEEEKIYSVAELKLFDTSKFIDIGGNKYYSEDGVTAAVVSLQGYIVDCGTWSDKYNNYTGVFIVDEYSADKNKSSEDAFQVYRVVRDSIYIKAEGDLKKGDLVTFLGCIQLYGGKIEMSYQGSTSVKCVDLVRGLRL